MEAICWLLIFISPVVASLAVAILVYTSSHTPYNNYLAISLLVIGFFSGILWAEKVRRSRGTVWFITQLHATPEPKDTTIKPSNLKSRSTKPDFKTGRKAQNENTSGLSK